MARIPLLDEGSDSLTPEQRQHFQALLDKRGVVFNVQRALAHNLVVARAIETMSAATKGGHLPRKDEELAYLATSVVNECFY
jgi:hypothetical protein